MTAADSHELIELRATSDTSDYILMQWSLLNTALRVYFV